MGTFPLLVLKVNKAVEFKWSLSKMEDTVFYTRGVQSIKTITAITSNLVFIGQ